MFDFPSDVFSLIRTRIRDLGQEINFLSEIVQKDSVILDLGCAVGQHLIALKKHDNSLHTIGVDITDNFIRSLIDEDFGPKPTQIEKADIRDIDIRQMFGKVFPFRGRDEQVRALSLLSS